MRPRARARGWSAVQGTQARWHAARVATAATAVVSACYLLCALGLNVVLASRLTGAADARLRPVLAQALAQQARAHGQQASSGPAVGPSSVPALSDDADDAPIFLWRVSASGRRTALVVGAPKLPSEPWSAAPLTAPVQSTPFRLDAARAGSGWLVAGESVADIGRARAALALPEVLFGLLLAAATFVGAWIVGLRASAPIDLIRRRQAAFTADASHELRTPLSVVEAEVDLALRRRRTPEEYEAVLQRIAGESGRLRAIVDDLLWLARADGDEGRLVTDERADVEAVVAACVDRFQPVAERLGVGLSYQDDGGGDAVVQAPPELVDRLVGVLVDNACKYAGPGGVAVVSVISAGGRVVLRVDDSGPGIPAAERNLVFDRFHRATASGGTDADAGSGAGLGLAIGDSVVRLTGGTWWVGDAPLGGARMEVSWRCDPGTSVPAAGDGQASSGGVAVGDPTGATAAPGAGAVARGGGPEGAAVPEGSRGPRPGAAAPAPANGPR